MISVCNGTRLDAFNEANKTKLFFFDGPVLSFYELFSKSGKQIGGFLLS